jgi:hypothetical protein
MKSDSSSYDLSRFKELLVTQRRSDFVCAVSLYRDEHASRRVWPLYPA